MKTSLCRTSSPMICVAHGKKSVLHQLIIIVKFSSNAPHDGSSTFIHTCVVCILVLRDTHQPLETVLSKCRIFSLQMEACTWENFTKGLLYLVLKSIILTLLCELLWFLFLLVFFDSDSSLSNLVLLSSLLLSIHLNFASDSRIES